MGMRERSWTSEAGMPGDELTKQKQEYRTCIRCGKAKPPDDFYEGQGNTCKQCTKERTAARRKADPVRYRATRSAWEKDNPARAKTRRKSRLKRRYSLSISQLHEMWVEQNYQCPICGTLIEFPDLPPNPLGDETTRGVVDHDHRDGHVRALLCSACNVGLGQFNDDTEL